MNRKPTNSDPALTASREALRTQLRLALEESRTATLSLFESIDAQTFCKSAHPDFSPVGWHLGHIGYTEGLWLLEHLVGREPLFPQYRRLFAADGLPKTDRCCLPSLTEISDYLKAIRTEVLAYLDIAPLEEQVRLWYWLLQHEAQHSETITLVLQLQGQNRLWLGEWPPQTVSPSARIAAQNTDDMVLIPAGQFQQGSESILALDNEQPVHTVELSTFWIDRYPVTRAQYRQFMAAGGYSDRRWWSEQGWHWLQEHPVSQPLYWHTTVADDHPVCGVSWYEAEAYANFVGKRLPTESEWEKAARWHPQTDQSYPFPWGDHPISGQRCNHGHLVGQSTPVFQYDQGQSGVGCYDLLGNVWEWTHTWFHPYAGFSSYPYAGYSTPYFDQAHRVLKGGSWATRAIALRSSFRNWYHPGTREILAGFRCARDADPEATAIFLADTSTRLKLEDLLRDLPAETLPGADVFEGLSQTPKTLPPKYFYDDRGSQLFEQICTLPEYYPTRTETWILQHYAGAIAELTGSCELVELGSGSSTKTRLLLDAYSHQGESLCYLPIDVSGGILKQSALELLQDYSGLKVHGLVATYEIGLQQLPQRQLPSRMILFLGSTLGNLTPSQCDRFFAQIGQTLQPGEFFLLGVDLQKSVAQLEAAYDDAQGVTAAFNLNMLQHLNWRFGGNFDLNQFCHRAFYNTVENQIEMHLESRCDQTVFLAELDLTIALQAGETIQTEISRKFKLSQIEQDLQTYGLKPLQSWTDPNHWFGLVLSQRV
uniref:Methyltransferase n=1 Tax=Cyanothece sp. (strain PCC 7425 / ATCC 29141) TaxID=395961 RepID=B8HYA1_CYAP4